MQIIAVATIKGGTGKSSTAAALAQAGTAAGMKVLALDLDPQSNLTRFIGADQGQPGTYQLITGEMGAADLIQKTEQGIDVIASSPDLATIRTTPGSAKRLQRTIEPLKKDYELILIDTPPTMGELTFNALQAATSLIIPLETDDSSVQSLYQITDIAHQIQRTNPDLSFIGVIVTRYSARSKFNRYVRGVIEEQAQAAGAAYLGEVREGIAIREAQGLRRSLYEYAPRKNPALDYQRIYTQITKQED